MTEFEIGEALTSNMGIVIEALSIYLTITSAYLVVAYLVGDKLARSQVVVVSTLFIVATLTAVSAMIGHGMRIVEHSQSLAQLNPDRIYTGTMATPVIMIFLMLSGIVASLKFMWDVRHPKTE